MAPAIQLLNNNQNDFDASKVRSKRGQDVKGWSEGKRAEGMDEGKGEDRGSERGRGRERKGRRKGEGEVTVSWLPQRVNYLK